MKADKRLSRLDFGEVTRPPSTARLRVPSAGEIQGMLSTGSVDDAVVLSRVRKLLERMNMEGRLRVKMSIADIGSVMDEIFPAPGVLDQKAYERYIDPADRTMVYKTVQDAFTTPRAVQQADLKNGFGSAAKMAGKVSSDAKGLRRVFGSKSIAAKSNYLKIKAKLNDLATKISTNITTDYNGDSEESLVAGWARFEDQHLHLRKKAVRDPSLTNSKLTFIHEASHLADSNINDLGGYMGTAGFVFAEEEVKLNNAAHYEVLPCVQWDRSCAYKKTPFKPGSVKPQTAEVQLKASAEEYCKKAWEAAGDFFALIKKVYLKQSVYGKYILRRKMNQLPLLTASKLMGLTLHKQNTYPPLITQLDVVTTESVVRAIGLVGAKVVAPKEAPSPNSKEFKKSVEKAVDDALSAYGGILDPSRDRNLVVWLHNHYNQIPPSF